MQSYNPNFGSFSEIEFTAGDLIAEARKNNDWHEKNKRRGELIRQFVREHNLIKLECGYLGMDSYYFDKKSELMYKVCNVCSEFGQDNGELFTVSYDSHIMNLNRHIVGNFSQNSQLFSYTPYE